MPPERSKQLVEAVRQWCKAKGIRNVDLARTLGISPQAVWNLFNGSSFPSAELALRLQELLLKDKNMPTITNRSLASRTAAHDDDDEPLDHLTGTPRTLYEASEMLDALRAELKQAKSAPAVVHAPATPARVTVTASVPAAAAVKPPATPTAPKTAPLVQPQTAWEREVARAHAVAVANLSDKPLEKQNVLELTSALNAEKDPDKKFAIYAELKSKKRAAKMAAGDAKPFDPAKDIPGFVKVEQQPAPIPKSLPNDADTPVKIQRILDLTPMGDLLSMLGNADLSNLQKALVYTEVRMRRGIVPNPE